MHCARERSRVLGVATPEPDITPAGDARNRHLRPRGYSATLAGTGCCLEIRVVIAAGGPTFAVRAEARGDDIRVVVAGEVDLSTAPALRDAVLGAIARAVSVVVVDLGNVSYLDSTGVHCLFDAAAAANGKSKAVRVEHAPAHVARVLRISGLADVMAIETDD